MGGGDLESEASVVRRLELAMSMRPVAGIDLSATSVRLCLAGGDGASSLLTPAVPYEVNGPGTEPLRQAVAGALLRVLLDHTEAAQGPVRRAVVALPCAFDPEHRQVALEAVAAVGVEAMEVLDAAVAAMLEMGPLRADRVIVADLGTQTEIVLLARDDQDWQVESARAIQLGGRSLDESIAGWADSEFEVRTGQSVRDTERQLVRRRAARAKITASTAGSAPLYVRQDGLSQKLVLTRGRVAGSAEPLIGAVLDAITDLDPGQVPVLLIGGTSHQPDVRTALDRALGDQLVVAADPDQLIARGAARAAGLRSEDVGFGVGVWKADQQTVEHFPVLGWGQIGSRSVTVVPTTPGQVVVELAVTEGSRTRPDRARVVARRIVPLPRQRAGDVLEVTLTEDADEILRVRVREQGADVLLADFEIDGLAVVEGTERDAVLVPSDGNDQDPHP